MISTINEDNALESLTVSSRDDVRYTKKDGAVYAFIFGYPFGETVLPDISYGENVSASLLENGAPIKTENADGKLKLVFPTLDPNEIRSKYVHTVKIKGV